MNLEEQRKDDNTSQTVIEKGEPQKVQFSLRLV